MGDCDALHNDHDWDDDEVRCLTSEMPSASSGDGRRRFASLGGDGRRRMSPFPPSNTPVDCRACWGGPGPTLPPQPLTAGCTDEKVADENFVPVYAKECLQLSNGFENVPSWKDCHDKCCQDPECEIVQWCAPNATCTRPNHCKMGKMHECSQFLGGDQDGLWHSNKLCYFGDRDQHCGDWQFPYDGFKTEQECQDRCCEDPACKVFEYNKDGFPEDKYNQGTCRLSYKPFMPCTVTPSNFFGLGIKAGSTTKEKLQDSPVDPDIR